MKFSQDLHRRTSHRTHKISLPESLRISWNEHHAVARVPRAISKFAPSDNKSDLTRTKWQEGCGSTCWNVSKYCAHHEKSTLKMWMPEAPKSACFARSSSCTKSKMTTVSQNENLEPIKTSSNFTKFCAGQETWLPRVLVILTHACQRFSNVQKVPRLPSGWKNVRCPAPVTCAGKSRPSEASQARHPFCASLRSRNAHGHLTREFLCERQTTPGGQNEHPEGTRALYSYC